MRVIRRWGRRAAVIFAAAVGVVAAAATATAQAPTFSASKPLSATVDYSQRYPTIGSVKVAGVVRVVVPPTPNDSPKLIKVNTELVNVEVTNDSGLRCAAREPQTFLLPADNTTTRFTGSYRLLPAGAPDVPPTTGQPGDQCRQLTLGISFDLRVDPAGRVQDITATPVYSDVNLID